jgi:hypothetical protein
MFGESAACRHTVIPQPVIPEQMNDDVGPRMRTGPSAFALRTSPSVDSRVES